MSPSRTACCSVLSAAALVPAFTGVAAAAGRPAPTAAVVTARTLHGYRVSPPFADSRTAVVRPHGCAAFTPVPAGASTAAAGFSAGDTAHSISGTARVVSFPSAAAAHAQLTARRALVARCHVDAVDNGDATRIVGAAKAVTAYPYRGTDEGLRTLATTTESDGDRLTTADSYYRRGSYVVEITTLVFDTAVTNGHQVAVPVDPGRRNLIQDVVVSAALQSLGSRR